MKTAILFITIFAPVFFNAFVQAMEIDKIQSQINDTRLENGTLPLKLNETLNLSAENKANDMCQKNYWAHSDPNGYKWNYFINLSGYSYSTIGESLARGYTNEAELINAWVNSPKHFENMIDNRYNEMGLAIVSCPGYLGVEQDDGFIVVNHFGDGSKLEIPEIAEIKVEKKERWWKKYLRLVISNTYITSY